MLTATDISLRSGPGIASPRRHGIWIRPVDGSWRGPWRYSAAPIAAHIAARLPDDAVRYEELP